jgi:glycogen operon protein
VNFITAHDGFTLQDLVSYNEKHNEANGEDNRDGTSNNASWNCGAEGSTDDPEILKLRARQKRNFLTTLMLSQGVPMLLAGDEFGNSQGGNNNAYCQDNEIGWLNWDNADQELIDFVGRLVKLRLNRSAISRPEFLTGARNAMGQRDVSWFGPDGTTMVEEKWHNAQARYLTVRLSPTRRDEPPLLVMFNAAAEDIVFKVPQSPTARWRLVLDTADPNAEGECGIGDDVPLTSRSLRVMEAAT